MRGRGTVTANRGDQWNQEMFLDEALIEMTWSPAWTLDDTLGNDGTSLKIQTTVISPLPIRGHPPRIP